MAEEEQRPKGPQGQDNSQQARKTGGNGSYTIPIQML